MKSRNYEAPFRRFLISGNASAPYTFFSVATFSSPLPRGAVVADLGKPRRSRAGFSLLYRQAPHAAVDKGLSARFGA